MQPTSFKDIITMIDQDLPRLSPEIRTGVWNTIDNSFSFERSKFSITVVIDENGFDKSYACAALPNALNSFISKEYQRGYRNAQQDIRNSLGIGDSDV